MLLSRKHWEMDSLWRVLVDVVEIVGRNADRFYDDEKI